MKNLFMSNCYLLSLVRLFLPSFSEINSVCTLFTPWNETINCQHFSLSLRYRSKIVPLLDTWSRLKTIEKKRLIRSQWSCAKCNSEWCWNNQTLHSYFLSCIIRTCVELEQSFNWNRISPRFNCSPSSSSFYLSPATFPYLYPIN